jgi:hypothetical protein
MERRIRIEIVGRNEFWRNAVFVEWDYQYPQRKLVPESQGFYWIPEEWLDDLRRVAEQCFSQVLLAPSDPGRRRLFRKLLLRDEQE